MKLYGYWRSSAAYRVRIALNLKGLAAEPVVVTLAMEGGDNRKPDYLARNPSGKLPTLEVDGLTLVQSLAILEYLEETHPEPPLLPGTPGERAAVRAFCQTVASDTHPLQNSRVLSYLKTQGGFSDGALGAWIHEWIGNGLGVLEETLVRLDGPGPFAFGKAVTLADVCLVPQVYNARRFGLDMGRFPRVAAVEAAANALPAFAAAAPEVQADAPKPDAPKED